MKIRHYGFLSKSASVSISTIRQMISLISEILSPQPVAEPQPLPRRSPRCRFSYLISPLSGLIAADPSTPPTFTHNPYRAS
jgi:hypothetical protein